MSSRISSPVQQAAIRTSARRPPTPRRRRTWRLPLVWAVFGISVVPLALTLGAAAPHARWAQRINGLAPVAELRAPAPFPAQWQGRWWALDHNYARFEKWFGDNVGLRNLMIRSKNELDYRLFGSSSRVYFGKDGELYGRHLSDDELPATEALLDSPDKRDAVYRGVVRFSEQLQAQGVTMVLIAPIQKQYFTRERLPYFAPRLPADSHFMALYQRLKATPQLHFIDVYGILSENQGKFPIYYRQDFHWTDPAAMAVGAATVELIAGLEHAPLRWRHRMEIETKPFVGSEGRFSARLSGNGELPEPALKQTWNDAHVKTARDAAASGFEFDTDTLADASLLPPTCMYGNSFSDGMLRAGLPEHFQRFSKLSRALTLQQVPPLLPGRCRYLIVQVLDIQADRWHSLIP